MQQIQKDNIAKLVQSSAILNEGERQEWLQLLDVMNDKQIMELEYILKSVIKPPAAPAAGNLSHIVNLPQSDAHAHDKNSTPHPKDEHVSYANNLKALLSEKDLPAGTERGTLGLPQTPPVERPVVAGFTKQARPVVPPAPKINQPVQKTQPVTVHLNEISHDFVTKPPVKKATTVPEIKNTGLQDPSVLIKAHIYKQQTDASAAQARVSQPRPAQIKASIPDLSPIGKAASGPEIKLSNLEDLAALSPRVWNSSSHEGIIKKIKDLIHGKGYHEVIFNLESSPLYKAYVSTGVELLQKGKIFEDLENEGSHMGTAFMNQDEFETFTDLLREIQAS